MKASPGCGKTWSGAAADSGSTTFPQLQGIFPDQLGRVTLETFYRAINKVERSLIRTDADEVTYNLHIMLRFDLELELLEGRLRVADLPEAWREGMRAKLGLVPPDDRDGCLQDVHWYVDGIGGGFQSYTIGNILSAQFYSAAIDAHPEIPARDRERDVRHAARLAARTHLPAWTQAEAERAGRAGHRRPDEHGTVSRLPAQKVRRDLSIAGAEGAGHDSSLAT